jgi:hypothetical protein
MTLFASLLLPTTPAMSQQSLPSVDALLARLHAYSVDYLAKLPSLTCDETISSQRWKGGKMPQEVNIESTLREIRTDKGRDPFSESHWFHTVDGHPPKPSFKVPFLAQGLFAYALGFMHSEEFACFDYQLAFVDEGKSIKLDMRLRPTNDNPACKQVPEEYRKNVRIDPGSGRILYLERSMSAAAARERKEVYFSSVEYAPRQLGDELIWLPSKMTGHDATDEGRMSVVYSNCHRYTSTTTIVPENATAPSN